MHRRLGSGRSLRRGSVPLSLPNLYSVAACFSCLLPAHCSSPSQTTSFPSTALPQLQAAILFISPAPSPSPPSAQISSSLQSQLKDSFSQEVPRESVLSLDIARNLPHASHVLEHLSAPLSWYLSIFLPLQGQVSSIQPSTKPGS